MALQKGIKGAGGKHDGNHGKPGYMSHLPDQKLKASTPHANASDSMSHSNLMSNCGGMEDSDGD